MRNSLVKRLSASLAEALHGEVDPRTLEIEVTSEDASLIINISYVLAALNKKEQFTFGVDSTGDNSG